MFDAINAFIQAHADQPWVLLVIALCTVIDGIFPPIPSESLVVGLAAISASTGTPRWWALALVAAAAAWVGDNLAYRVGRAIGIRWLTRRFPRLVRALDRAEHQLERRGAMIIIVARFIPGGRVAVNLTCGASGFVQRRFMILTAISGVSWAAYSVGLGMVAGAWLDDNPILAATIGIVMAVVLGIAVDQVLQRIFPYRPDDGGGHSNTGPGSSAPGPTWPTGGDAGAPHGDDADLDRPDGGSNRTRQDDPVLSDSGERLWPDADD